MDKSVVTRAKKRKTEGETFLGLRTHLPAVFEEGVISKLNGTDLKFFARASKTCREAVRRAKEDDEAENWLKFKVSEMSSISTLEWAWEEGFPFDEGEWNRKKEGFIAQVAKGGNVDLLRWLREEKNCPWGDRTCSWAAYDGHLECLQYAHKNGCPLTGECWRVALNEPIREYLRISNCPGST